MSGWRLCQSLRHAEVDPLHVAVVAVRARMAYRFFGGVSLTASEALVFRRHTELYRQTLRERCQPRESPCSTRT